MKRLLLSLGVSLLIPAAALAQQTTTPAPLPAPAPMVAAVPTQAPAAPGAVVPLEPMDPAAIEQAVAAAKAQADQANQATAAARADVAQAAQAEAQARQWALTSDLQARMERLNDLDVGTLRATTSNLALRMAELQDRVSAFPFQARDSETADYDAALNFMNQRQYDQAVARFDKVVAQKGAHADGALYWKAWSQYKLGTPDDALATLGALRKDYPKSRYLKDATTLEATVKQAAPANAPDDDLKLLAINAMRNTDPDQAVTALQGVLNQTNSLQVKKNALYVLALVDGARAHEILMSYATGAGNPDLQQVAISYLAARRSDTLANDLKQIYDSSSDPSVRRAVIAAYADMSGTRAFRYMVAPVVASRPARNVAADGRTVDLTVSGRVAAAAPNPAVVQDLWQIYQQEPSADLRGEIVRTLASMGATDQVVQAAKTDKDESVRRDAINSLAMSMQRGGDATSQQTSGVLLQMYKDQSDTATRTAIIRALAARNDATDLVAIARQETNPDLKKEIVRDLSGMASTSKVAADYLMEIIK